MQPELPDKPNLVLIVVDALRASNVSFLGYSRETTPNLDVLANEAYVFEQAISVGGNTPTAMSGMMTGRYPFVGFDEDWSPESAFGMRRFYADASESGLPRSLPTLAEQLKGAGYTTYGAITNPYLKSLFNFHRGFDRYEEIFREKGVPYGLGESVSQSVIDFLRSGTDKPFFLYLHFMDTHGPYFPPAPYRTMFLTDDRHDEFPQLWKRWQDRVDLEGASAEALHEYILSLYDGSIAYVDASIAEVLLELEDLGLMRDTVIAVTADHGEEFLEHGGTTHQGTLYDEIVRVPLMLRIPGRDGERIPDLVRSLDLYPTFLGLAGIDTSSQQLDAVNLLPLIDQEKESLRLVTYAGFPTVRMLRTTRYKLLHYRSGKKELFDLVQDPDERQNLYPADTPGASDALHSGILARMEARLASLEESLLDQKPVTGPGPKAVDQETRDQLRALGYLN